jgi:hypothetical protein
MAHTYDTARYRDVWGTRNVRKARITLVDNYVTGGWPLTAQALGFGSTSDLVAVIPMNSAIVGGLVSWDDIAGKLKAFDYAGVEITNGNAAMAGQVVHALVIGTGKNT